MSFRGSSGRSRGGRFRGRSDGGGGGRSHQGFRPQAQGSRHTDTVFQVCKFFLEGTCRNEQSCRFSHAISVYQNVQAHQQPIKSIAMVEDGSRLLTGSADKTIKIWNPNADKWSPENSIDLTGGVQHIEVKDDVLVLSTDVVIDTISSGDPVGLVQLINTKNNIRVECKRSELFPYTHPASVRTFCVAVNEGELYLITAGGEGIIRTWKFNSVAGTFEALAVLEGHIRGVTSLVLIGGNLWSGSIDRSLRCWDVATGVCVGVLTSSNGGHAEPITCLEKILMDDTPTAVTYLASGGSDGEVVIWNTATGTKEWNGSHGEVITSLLFTQDKAGNRLLVVGLAPGSMIIRSLSTMNILIRIEAVSVCHVEAVWAMMNLGNGYFATGGNDGRLVVWNVETLEETKA
eukprot:CAMPEP_0182425288 /NCGR_PEP_ID=MMETSP1167-20130531/11656_1 /TAXON_ID=2988 /ORGANISM="Mallomonas Sp, Strain CCMP3275" /LENGTH=402 /DNA_ID=CAMNT_0024605825 /DNA_START=127 /DNA_END=1335 /DNA_ORIENTATION=+